MAVQVSLPFGRISKNFFKENHSEEESIVSTDMRSSWELEYSKEILHVSDHFPVVLLSTISELPVSIFCSLSTELKWNAPIALKQRCSTAAGFTHNHSGVCLSWD